MADNINDLINKIKSQSKVVDELLKKGEELSRQEAAQLKREEKKLSVLKNQYEQKKLSLKVANDERKETEKFLQSFVKLNGNIKKQLEGQNNIAGNYLGIGRQISKEKSREGRYEEATTKFQKQQKANIQSRLSILGDVNDDLLSQAKATQTAEDSLRGTSELQKKLRDLEAQKGSLTKQQYELVKSALIQTDKLRQKEERLTYLKEQQSELTKELPNEIQESIEFTKSLGTAIQSGFAPIFLVGAVLLATLKSFIDISEAAQSFREQTGLLKNDTQELNNSIRNVTANTSSLGATFKEVADAAATFSTEFQNNIQPSQQLLENVVVLNKNFGISTQELAEVNKLFQSIAGVSADTAGFMASTVVQAADLAGVSPNQVIEDIAKNAEEALKYFGGSVQELTSAAIQAAKLGTSLEQSAEVAKSLLDFESSITSELEASAILGTRINFNDARRLAANGKILEAQQAVLDEVSKIGDITRLNVFEQEALAEAAGMPLSDLLFQQQIRNNLTNLDKEELNLAMQKLKAGTDISDISKEQLQNETASLAKQQQIQSEVTQLKNVFMGVVATVGSALIPLLESLMPVLQIALAPVVLMANGFKSIVDFTKEYSNILGPIATVLGTVWAIQKGIVLWQKKEAILRLLNLKRAAATASLSALSNPVKALAGLAVAALVVGAVSSIMAKADDFMSMPNGYGKRMLTTPEGTFAINDNDTIIGGTEIDKVQNSSTVGSTQNNNVVGNNLPDLAAPMNMMIQELKALRNDMNTGKVAVYLDGKKVTSQISRIVDKSSKNSYAI